MEKNLQIYPVRFMIGPRATQCYMLLIGLLCFKAAIDDLIHKMLA